MKWIRNTYKILARTIDAFLDDNCLKLSASLSYYALFAMAPILLIIISLVGLMYGGDAATGKIYEEMKELIGSSSALQIQEIIANIQQRHSTTKGAIVGSVILFIGATGVFTEIQGSINYIWSVKAKPKKGWRKFLIDRLLSFSLVMGLGLILVVSLIVSTLMALLSTKLTVRFPNSTVYFFQLVNWGITLVVITGLFMVIFKVLPDAIISWRDALIGSVVTSILFLLGKFLIGVYLQGGFLDVTYGTAASVIILLTWVYYSSVILYFGAEFTKVFALASGHGIKPKRTAVFILKSESNEIPQSRLNA